MKFSIQSGRSPVESFSSASSSCLEKVPSTPGTIPTGYISVMKGMPLMAIPSRAGLSARSLVLAPDSAVRSPSFMYCETSLRNAVVQS